jgi:hypothetical protein
MTRNSPFEEPSEVAAEDGAVIVDGPDGIAVSLTPDAAEQTARRLSDAAREARRQTPPEKLPDE